MYQLDGSSFPLEQDIMEQAYKKKKHPSCQCSKYKPLMYIAYVHGQYIIKRFPDTGHKHGAGCEHYAPPPEISGLGVLAGTAIQNEFETTTLKLDFALTKRGRNNAPTPGVGEGATEATTDQKKMTLTSLLHYLWDEAELVKWFPKMHGKRNWYIIRRALMSAVEGELTKGFSIDSRIFIPEVFNLDDKDEIRQRRMSFFSDLKTSVKSGTALGVLIAEYKQHEETPMGAKFTFKHLPGCSFFADSDFLRRFNTIAMDKINLIDFMGGGHLISIATFYISEAGYPMLQDMGFMMVNEQWIPFEHRREYEFIHHLVENDKPFVKTLRYNLKPSAPIASAVLSDSGDPVAAYVAKELNNASEVQMLAEIGQGGVYPAVYWTDTGLSEG